MNEHENCVPLREFIEQRMSYIERDITEIKQQRKEDMAQGQEVIKSFSIWREDITKTIAKAGGAIAVVIFVANYVFRG